MSKVKIVNLFFVSLLIFSLLFFAVNCNKKNQGSNAKAEESYSNVNDETAKANDSPASNSSAPKVLIVKGFYIGMSKEEAKENILKKNMKFYECQIPGGMHYITSTPCGEGGYSIFTLFFENNNADFIEFFCGTFNACDMTPDSFAHEFMVNYGIPKMEPIENGWIYESDFGWKLEIGNFSSKSVKIRKIASEAQRKFD